MKKSTIYLIWPLLLLNCACSTTAKTVSEQEDIAFKQQSEIIPSQWEDSSSRGPASLNLREKVQRKVNKALQKDLRTKITRVNSGICGSVEPGYIAEVQIRRLIPLNPGKFDAKWETVKKYGILESEVDTPRTLMPEESCME